MFTATALTHAPLVNSRLARLAKSKKDRNGEFYVLVGNTGGDVNLSDADEAETTRIFRHGSCLAFAYATALVTGLPLAFFTVSKKGESWSGHAAVQLPTGEFFDITGTTSQSEILSYFKLTGSSVTPVIYKSFEAAHAVLKGSQGDAEAFSYLLKNVNELGLLVTFHFVEQVLSFYNIPFDMNRLRELEKKTVAYARKASREAKSSNR